MNRWTTLALAVVIIIIATVAVWAAHKKERHLTQCHVWGSGWSIVCDVADK